MNMIITKLETSNYLELYQDDYFVVYEVVSPSALVPDFNEDM